MLATLAERPRGLVLVTGPTGSGKSTTLAAMIDKINTERHDHILTIEDPIEYMHAHKNCLVNQREVHSDTHCFADALRAALREDPDVVLIGEMRDLETIESALQDRGDRPFDLRDAAHELGGADDQPRHRRLSGAPAGADSGPAVARARGRSSVRRCCRASTARGGSSSMEIMVPTPAIRNLIREDKIHQIYSSMQAGQEKLGCPSPWMESISDDDVWEALNRVNYWYDPYSLLGVLDFALRRHHDKRFYELAEKVIGILRADTLTDRDGNDVYDLIPVFAQLTLDKLNLMEGGVQHIRFRGKECVHGCMQECWHGFREIRVWSLIG